MQYRTIVADPPWQQGLVSGGRYRAARNSRPRTLPYPTMTLDAIGALPIGALAEPGAHLWLWTTNAFLEPSGPGAWFAGTTQHCLFGYYQRCQFHGRRYAPTHFHANPKRHSQKPEEFYGLVEEVSDPARLELFARRHRLGWDAWGNEVESTIAIAP